MLSQSTSHDWLHASGAEMRARSMIAAAAQPGLSRYVILYFAVAASWVGIPIVGAGALAAAGVLASNGQLNLWVVIVVATFASWTGGYVGYWLGGRAGSVVADHRDRWQRQRRQAMAAGEHIYRRWGRLAVFVTPTWVSGALRMSRGTFLVWNALAALVSTCIATLGAYGVGTAVIGQLSARRGTLALAVAAFALAAVAVAAVRRGRPHGTRRPTHAAPEQTAADRAGDAQDRAHGHTSKTIRGHG